MHRRILTSCLVLTLALSAAPHALGAPSEGSTKKVQTTTSASGALMEDPLLTVEEETQLAELTREKEARYGIGDSEVGAQALNSYGLVTRPVSNFKQEKTYWCGPACARQSLSFHKTHSKSSTALPSQTTLASAIGTTTDGSSTSKMVQALNSYDGRFGKVWYLASDITDTANPYHTFVNRIGTMLRTSVDGTAPIILTRTSFLARYGTVSSRHYMNISGIDDRTAPMQMRSVDPHFNSAYYGVRWESVGTTTTSKGLCRATHEADLEGSNKVMAW